MNFDLGNLYELRRGSNDFFKNYILKSEHCKEKDEVCLSFVVKIFTKTLHRRGVISLQKIFFPIMKRNTELAYAQGCAATRGHLSKLKRTDSFNFENRA